jgi:hypothetical protein
MAFAPSQHSLRLDAVDIDEQAAASGCSVMEDLLLYFGAGAAGYRNRHEGRELIAERQKSIPTGLFSYEKHRERDRRDHRQGNA